MTTNDKTAQPDLTEILDLENAVWQALVTGDADADHALLLPEFLGVYPSGFSDRDGHSGQLSAGPSVQDYTLTDARLTPVGTEHVMLSYRADYRRIDVLARDVMYVSSLWQRSGSVWRNLFSQDTPAEPGTD